MQLSKLPHQELLESAVRQAWPVRHPSDDLKARSLYAALEVMKQGRKKSARFMARRLATALYAVGFATALLLMLLLASDAKSTPGASLRLILGSLLATI